MFSSAKGKRGDWARAEPQAPAKNGRWLADMRLIDIDAEIQLFSH